MAENLTIARPYAQAVFEIAKEHDSFDRWGQTLEALSYAVSDERVLKVLQGSSPAASGKIVADIMGELLDEQGKNLVCIIGENRRFDVLPEIYQEFVRLRDDFLKVKAVEVVTARPLKAADRKAVTEKLEKKYGSKISLTETVDPSLIGGIIIRIGDEVIDGSIRTSLNSLSSTLK